MVSQEVKQRELENTGEYCVHLAVDCCIPLHFRFIPFKKLRGKKTHKKLKTKNQAPSFWGIAEIYFFKKIQIYFLKKQNQKLKKKTCHLIKDFVINFLYDKYFTQLITF